jgi:hypothetical protein
MILKRIADEAQMVEFTETPRLLNAREGWRMQRDPADWTNGTDFGDGWDY